MQADLKAAKRASKLPYVMLSNSLRSASLSLSLPGAESAILPLHSVSAALTLVLLFCS